MGCFESHLLAGTPHPIGRHGGGGCNNVASGCFILFGQPGADNASSICIGDLRECFFELHWVSIPTFFDSVCQGYTRCLVAVLDVFQAELRLLLYAIFRIQF
jgi:hypothetical protein